jgi:Flp pilus assembly protein TadB
MAEDKEALSGTKQVALSKLEKDAHLREKEIDSETHLKDKALDLEVERIRLESKKIDNAAEDEKRNDRRELVRTFLLWSFVIFCIVAFIVIVCLCLWFGQTLWLTAFVGTVLGLGLVALAIRYGRSINFSGFGFSAKTGSKSTEDTSGDPKVPPSPEPQKPEDK